MEAGEVEMEGYVDEAAEDGGLRFTRVVHVLALLARAYPTQLPSSLTQMVMLLLQLVAVRKERGYNKRQDHLIILWSCFDYSPPLCTGMQNITLGRVQTVPHLHSPLPPLTTSWRAQVWVGPEKSKERRSATFV